MIASIVLVVAVMVTAYGGLLVIFAVLRMASAVIQAIAGHKPYRSDEVTSKAWIGLVLLTIGMAVIALTSRYM